MGTSSRPDTPTHPKGLQSREQILTVQFPPALALESRESDIYLEKELNVPSARARH